MRFLLFISIFLFVMALANYYIYKRFLKRVGPGFSRYAFIIPSLLMLGEIFFVADTFLGLIPDSPTLYLINSTFIGITFMLFVVATLYDLVVTASSRVPFDRERRKTIKMLFDVSILLAAFSYLFRGFNQGITEPTINTAVVRVDNFAMDRFTIVQLSDTHVGRTIKRDFVESMVARTNALKPDMVVITGDLVDLPVNKIIHDLEPLKDLTAPTYFILGNHDMFNTPRALIHHLASLNIYSLLNTSVIIKQRGKRFNLVGINDLSGERRNVMAPDIPAAFANIDPSLPTIVLAHQPKTITLLGDYPCDLMLSGHTHGGQIFPFGALVMIGQPYLAGLHRHGHDKQIFISRGTGFWGPPMRVLAPSEISRIVITGT
jgi:predicted MPP superfamily phosphohydrolase